MGPSAISKAGQLIVRFYDPDIKAEDAHNRTLEEILSWPDSRLESSHNYIQMLFPLPEGSMFNWTAPVVDLAVMQAFLSRRELRQQLRRSFERMLSFYGFQVSTEPKEPGEQEAAFEKTQTETETDTPIGADTSVSKIKVPPGEPTSSSAPDENASVSDALPYSITRASNWQRQFRNWAVLFNHNHLRITRILRCLRVLGLQQEATAFFAALERVFQDPQIKISRQSMRFWQLAVTRPLYWAPDGDMCQWLKTWEREQEGSNASSRLHSDV